MSGDDEATMAWAFGEIARLRARVAELEADLHARNVEAKSATIQAVGLRKQMADAIDLLRAR